MMSNQPALTSTDIWPSLPLDAWQETYTTLHMWTQIIGKIRFTQTPWINHSWHIPLYLTVRGLTTSTGTGFLTGDGLECRQ